MRAGLLDMRHDQRHVRGAGQRGIGARRDRDERHAKTPRVDDDVAQLGRLARPRQGDDDIVGRDGAEISVACFGGVDEEGGGSGRGQGRRDLRADMAALAHAGDDDPPRRAGNRRAGTLEGLAHLAIQGIFERDQSGDSHPQRARRRRDRWRRRALESRAGGHVLSFALA
jgi:hypothetical protein